MVSYVCHGAHCLNSSMLDVPYRAGIVLANISKFEDSQIAYAAHVAAGTETHQFPTGSGLYCTCEYLKVRGFSDRIRSMSHSGDGDAPVPNRIGAVLYSEYLRISQSSRILRSHTQHVAAGTETSNHFLAGVTSIAFSLSACTKKRCRHVLHKVGASVSPLSKATHVAHLYG